MISTQDPQDIVLLMRDVEPLQLILKDAIQPVTREVQVEYDFRVSAQWFRLP